MTTTESAVTIEVEAGAVGFDAARLARLDTHFQRYVDDGRLPGFAVLVSRRGQIAHLGVGGHRDVEAGAALGDDTVFRIYSMTKPITSVAAMILYERGAFELNDPISRYLPEFSDMRVFTGGSDLKPMTAPATQPIRVWHLLTHTSGLTYGFHHAHPVDAIYRARGYEWTAPPGVDLAGAVESFADMPLLFEPGNEWNYSVSTDVLGRMVEVLYGAPLDVALRELVLDPLAMHETSFAVPDSRRERLAALYTPSVSGGILRNDALGDLVVAPTWLSGGGGLTSTLADYHRFTQFLLGRGRLGDVRLLGDRTVRYMSTNQLPANADLATFGRPLFAETPFDGVGFGLGFSVTLDPPSTRTLGTAGEFAWGGAASTAFWVDPTEELTVLFMTQLLPSSTYPIRSQLKQLVYSALVD